METETRLRSWETSLCQASTRYEKSVLLLWWATFAALTEHQNLARPTRFLDNRPAERLSRLVGEGDKQMSTIHCDLRQHTETSLCRLAQLAESHASQPPNTDAPRYHGFVSYVSAAHVWIREKPRKTAVTQQLTKPAFPPTSSLFIIQNVDPLSTVILQKGTDAAAAPTEMARDSNISLGELTLLTQQGARRDCGRPETRHVTRRGLGEGSGNIPGWG